MPTKTELAQLEVAEKCLPLLAGPDSSLVSLRPAHTKVLRFMLGLDGKSLPSGFLALDASHPWLVFWPVNALHLLGQPLTAEELAQVGETLIACQHPDGGFGGGPGQPGHLAATYAALMALSHTGPEYWAQINPEKLLTWILSLKRADGSIRVCKHGEADPRSTYCALASLRMLGIHSAEVAANLGRYIRSCQTYEGGFANQPHGEAHGGYAFCSVATLMLLDPSDPRAGLRQFSDLARLQRWLVSRQDQSVPGFSGRTNKLVDGCYSHWVGGCWPLIDQLIADPHHRSLFSRQGLRDYIVKCCQDVKGGLRDKPGVRPDAYHSNYVLCGLAAARYSYIIQNNSVFEWEAQAIDNLGAPAGDLDNYVPPINPVFGVPLEAASQMHAWMAGRRSQQQRRQQELDAEREVVPASKEYQGFALYIGASALLLSYLAWSLLPADVLHALQLDYYPSRWWAVAIPAFLLMTMLYIYVALSSYNLEKLTFSPTAPQTICDRDTKVQDTPLVVVNNALYK